MWLVSWLSSMCHCQWGGSAVFPHCGKQSHTGGNYLWRGDRHGFLPHTHSQIHTPTFMHGHMVPGAHMYDSHYVCVYWAMDGFPLRAMGWVNILSTLGQSTTQFVPVDPCPACLYPLIWTESNQADPVNNTQARPWKTTIAPQCIPLISPGTPVFVQSLWSRREAVYGGTIKMIKDSS